MNEATGPAMAPYAVDGWAKELSEYASNRADPPVMPWPIQPMTCPPT